MSSSPTHVEELGIKGTSGTLAKCGKSRSLEVGERSAQKIKIGEASAENPSKGVEFSYARQGTWHKRYVGDLAKGVSRTKDPDSRAKCRKSRQTHPLQKTTHLHQVPQLSTDVSPDHYV